jgi:hypothetical protein
MKLSIGETPRGPFSWWKTIHQASQNKMSGVARIQHSYNGEMDNIMMTREKVKLRTCIPNYGYWQAAWLALS